MAPARFAMPDPANELERRLTALESVAAHQEIVAEELSEQLARQWAEIDRLTRAVQNLERRLASLDEHVTDMPVGDAPDGEP